MFNQADKEGRPLTADERSYAQGLLNEADDVGAMEKQLAGLGHQLGGGSMQTLNGGQSGQHIADDPGTRFIQSEGFKAIADPTNRSERWTTGLVEISDGPFYKTNLFEGAGAPGSGTGGGLVPVPQVVPGVVQTLFQPLTIESLLLSGQADTSTVRYIVEGTATSAAAGVAEGGTKPESVLGLSTKDEPIKKVATFLPVSDELLEDAAATQSFVNQRLGIFVQNEVERQLFRGTASGNEVQGIFTSRTVPIYTGGTADTKAEQLFKGMNSMRGSVFIEPDFVVVHPTDYQVLRLLKDSSNQYLGGGPWLGPYGGPQGPVGNSNQTTTAPADSLWGKPLYVTANIGGAGTALIGTHANAQVWSRGGLRAEATNAHSNFFQIDLVAMRAERRLGLTMYRSGGFVEARLAVGPGG